MHWGVDNIEKTQDDVLNFENFHSKMILLGDFYARAGVSEDFVELDE